MTDSSFAINLTRIDSRKNHVEWNATLTIPADFSYNDEMLIDANAVYLLGRGASIFRKDLSLEYVQLPYVLKVDVASGMQQSLYFLPIDTRDNFIYHLNFLESI